MRTLFFAALAALLLPAAVAQDAPPAEATGEAAPTIADVLQADGRFTILLSAVETAGLTETLAEPGPYTVFAPTDEAFAALPEGTLAALTPEDLQNVLLRHVVLGEVTGEQAAAAGTAPSAWSDEALTFSLSDDGELMVDDAMVIEADVAASNGVVHVLNAVLLPVADEAAPMEDDMDGDDGMEEGL